MKTRSRATKPRVRQVTGRWSIVSTRCRETSITMLLERARATNSWNCVAYLSSSSRVGNVRQRRATVVHPAPQTMPGHESLSVIVFAQRQGARVREAEADVVHNAPRRPRGCTGVRVRGSTARSYVGARPTSTPRASSTAWTNARLWLTALSPEIFSARFNAKSRSRPSKSRSMPLARTRGGPSCARWSRRAPRNESARLNHAACTGPTGIS